MSACVPSAMSASRLLRKPGCNPASLPVPPPPPLHEDLWKRNGLPSSGVEPPSLNRKGLVHVGDAGADQRLVDDDPEGEADQDWCEGCEPRSLRRVSDGRGRHLPAFVPRHSAADRGTASTARSSASVKCSIVSRSRPTDGRGASR